MARHQVPLDPSQPLKCPYVHDHLPALRRALTPDTKPFCARCGWNLQRAELAVAGKSAATTIGPLAIGLFAIIIAVLVAQKNPPVASLLPVLVGAILLIPFWSRFSMRKAVAAAKFTVNPSLASAQPFVDPALQQMQSLPRPRRVRFRTPGALKAVLALTLILGFGGLWFATNFKPAPRTPNVRVRSNPSGLVVVPIVFVVLLVVPYFREKRNLPLMRDGELALGRVTYQQNVQQGKSNYSRIGYEFKTSSGQLIQDQAKDLTYSVFEDMTIPVFYDPTNPAKNVTPCATYLQVSANRF